MQEFDFDSEAQEMNEIGICPIEKIGAKILIGKVSGRSRGKTMLVTVGFGSPISIAMDEFFSIVYEMRPAAISGQLFLAPYLKVRSAINSGGKQFISFDSDCMVGSLFKEITISRIDRFLDYDADELSGDLISK